MNKFGRPLIMRRMEPDTLKNVIKDLFSKYLKRKGTVFEFGEDMPFVYTEEVKNCRTGSVQQEENVTKNKSSLKSSERVATDPK